MKSNQLRLLINSYYDMQDQRIRMGNQIRSLEKEKEEHETLKNYYSRFYDIEKDVSKDIKKAIKDHPMYPFCEETKGMGHILSACLLSSLDPHKADHVSSFWKYAGLTPTSIRKKGEKISWSPFVKKTCFLIGKSFVKQKGSKYREIYDTSKEFYIKKFPEPMKVKGTKKTNYTKGHLDSMSRRKVVKIFLSNFWAEWRKLENLEVSAPFSHRDDKNFKYN